MRLTQWNNCFETAANAYCLYFLKQNCPKGSVIKLASCVTIFIRIHNILQLYSQYSPSGNFAETDQDYNPGQK